MRQYIDIKEDQFNLLDSGVRRSFQLLELVQNSNIAPMVPLIDSTKGLVTAEHTEAFSDRSLVVQVTRIKACDTEALDWRVHNDELFYPRMFARKSR